MRRKHKSPVLAATNKPTKAAESIITRAHHNISKTNISPNALKVLNRLQQQNYAAYLVGGGVRDLSLKIAPKDFDVVTNARPNEIKRLFRNSRLIGRRFRLAHIQYGREIIEVSTFRSGEVAHDSNEFATKDGMIVQDNVYGNIHQDAVRRDFTINSLYYNVKDSTIKDFTGGYEDLKNKIVRIIGDPLIRYQEDPVRMLRAIRFCAKLNFHLAPETAAPIAANANLLLKVSGARLFDEVIKLYHSGKALQTHKLLCQYKLFEHLFPLTAASLEQGTHTEELLTQTLENTDNRINSDRPVTFSFLLSALLWHPLLREAEILQNNGTPPLAALELAMSKIISMQNATLPIPKKFIQVMREIWMLQYRLPRRYGLRPFKILEHPRFRAGYDFLLIRAICGEEELELAEWWTTFQECDPETQSKMVELASRKKKMPKRKSTAVDG